MTVIVPELMILYWFPPSVLDSTCTGLVAVVVAEMTTVLPQGENGADTDIIIDLIVFAPILQLVQLDMQKLLQ
jgi:hypothetical protein